MQVASQPESRTSQDREQKDNVDNQNAGKLGEGERAGEHGPEEVEIGVEITAG